MLVGLSLSLCVKDILEGKIKLENVRYLITSTMCFTDIHFDDVVFHYVTRYWKDFPWIEVSTIVYYFWENDLIYQPRCDELNPPRIYGRESIWIELKDGIEWR